MLEDFEQFLSLTSLTPEEFRELYEIVEEYACRAGYRRYSQSAKKNNWGAGRPHKRPLIDRLAMTVMRLRGLTEQATARIFGVKHDVVRAAFNEIIVILKNCLDTPKRVVARLLRQGANASLLEFMPGSDVAVDAMVVNTTRPPRGAAGKRFYRRKKGVGLNIQTIVDMGGYVIDVSKFVPASGHDITLFRQHANKALLRHFQSVFGDAGYTGAKDVPPARMIISSKRPPNGELNDYQHAKNKWIGSKRYVVERNNSYIKNNAYIKQRHWYESAEMDDVVQVICGLINFRTVRRKKRPINWRHSNRTPRIHAPNPDDMAQNCTTTSCQTVFDERTANLELPPQIC